MSELQSALESADVEGVKKCIARGDDLDMDACTEFRAHVVDANPKNIKQIKECYTLIFDESEKREDLRRKAKGDELAEEDARQKAIETDNEEQRKKEEKAKKRREAKKARRDAKRNEERTKGTATSSTQAVVMDKQTIGETTANTPHSTPADDSELVNSGDLEVTKPPKGQDRPASSSTMETQAQDQEGEVKTPSFGQKETMAGTSQSNEQGEPLNGNEDSTGFIPVLGYKSAKPKNISPLKLNEEAIETALEEPFVFKEVDLEAVPPRMATTPQAFLELASEDLSAAHPVTASNHIYKAFTSLVDVFGSQCGFTIHTAKGYRILGKEFCPRKISQFFNAKANTRDEFLDAMKKRADFEAGMNKIFTCHSNFHRENLNKAFVNKAGTAAAKLLTDFRAYYKEGVFDRFDEFTVDWAESEGLVLQYFDVTRP